MTADILRTLSPLIPALRRYARALLHDAWDADDLVQETRDQSLASTP